MKEPLVRILLRYWSQLVSNMENALSVAAYLAVSISVVVVDKLSSVDPESLVFMYFVFLWVVLSGLKYMKRLSFPFPDKQALRDTFLYSFVNVGNVITGIYAVRSCTFSSYITLRRVNLVMFGFSPIGTCAILLGAAMVQLSEDVSQPLMLYNLFTCFAYFLLEQRLRRQSKWTTLYVNSVVGVVICFALGGRFDSRGILSTTLATLLPFACCPKVLTIGILKNVGLNLIGITSLEWIPLVGTICSMIGGLMYTNLLNAKRRAQNAEATPTVHPAPVRDGDE